MSKQSDIAYLEFVILDNIKALEELKPDHLLVRTTRAVLSYKPKPEQLSLDLKTPGTRAQAE